MKKIFFRNMFWALPLLFALVGMSCSLESDYDKQVEYDDSQISQYLKANSITATKHSLGFYYQKLVENTAGDSLVSGDVIEFYYKISRLDNGNVIAETTPGNDEPALFKVGTTAIVPYAIASGIFTMKVGEKSRFYVPSYLAFGSYSHNLFPANSIFIIDINITNQITEDSINTRDADSVSRYVAHHYADSIEYTPTSTGLYYIPETLGTGNQPDDYSGVIINFTRKYLNGDTIREAEDFSFYLDHNQAVSGLEEGIKLMKERGTAHLIMPSKLGFGNSLCVIPETLRSDFYEDGQILYEVKPYSPLIYEVELESGK
jgi:FKBP-type peptidyl-prolyl cis-trans isomerase FkpA